MSYLEKIGGESSKTLSLQEIEARRKAALSKGHEMFKAWQEKKAARREASKTPAPQTPPLPTAAPVTPPAKSPQVAVSSFNLSPSPAAASPYSPTPAAAPKPSSNPAPKPSLTTANVALLSKDFTPKHRKDADQKSDASSISSAEALNWISQPSSRATSTLKERSGPSSSAPSTKAATNPDVATTQGQRGYVKKVQQLLVPEEASAPAPQPARVAPSHPAPAPAPSRFEDRENDRQLVLQEELMMVRQEMLKMQMHMSTITTQGLKALAQIPKLVKREVSRSKSRGRSRNNSRTTSPAPPMIRGADSRGLGALGASQMVVSNYNYSRGAPSRSPPRGRGQPENSLLSGFL